MSETASADSPLLADVTATGDEPVLRLGTVSPQYEASYPAVGYDREGIDTTFGARITMTPTRAWGW